MECELLRIITLIILIYLSVFYSFCWLNLIIVIKRIMMSVMVFIIITIQFIDIILAINIDYSIHFIVNLSLVNQI